MKLTGVVKLLPSHEQSALLQRTLEEINAACNTISEIAWERQTFNRFKLHHACYYQIRETTDLSAQMVGQCIGKVAEAYKSDKRTKRKFKPHGAIAYNDRILRWYADRVSIWAIGGRQSIPFVCDERTRKLLAMRQGESDLIVRDGKWFLAFTANIEEPLAGLPDDYLGVDLGIVNLATDSDGMVYSGADVNGIRHRHRRLRAKLQAKGTRGARRRLKRRRHKERRFARHVNHVISKQIVATAKGTGRGIALEDLTGIRDRVSVRRSQRATLHSWSFRQLRDFIAYKAALAGVPVVLVDPRNTSRTCPACGCIDKANRPSQAVFSCVACGLAGPADHIAAIVIGRRGAVNRPYCPDAGPVPVPPGQSSPL